MHNHASPHGRSIPRGELGSDRPALPSLTVGTRLGPLEVTVNAAANDRFWTAAGAECPAETPDALYPPIAAQFAIMLTRDAIAPAEVLHAGQHLACHALGRAGDTLVTTGEVTARYDKRGRTYVEVTTDTRTSAGEQLWTGRSTFCAL